MVSGVISQDLPVPATIHSAADIVGFGPSGVFVLRNSFKAQKAHLLNNFGSNSSSGGWTNNKHVRLLADTTGDGRKDIVGFGELGVLVALSNRDNTFQKPKLVLSGFSYSNGSWRVEKHLRFMADLRNSGRADIVGFGDRGVLVSLNLGNGSFAPPKIAIHGFGYDYHGWRIERHLRFLADVTGDRLPDIVGFGEQVVFVAQNNGDGTFKPAKAVLEAFCANPISGGWTINRHPRFVADLTGNGKADLIGFADGGVYVALNNGDGTFQPLKKVLSKFGFSAGGWTVEKHPRFIVDLTGDGCSDIFGFGEYDVFAAYNKGDGTFSEMTTLPSLKYLTYGRGGWRVNKHKRCQIHRSRPSFPRHEGTTLIPYVEISHETA